MKATDKQVSGDHYKDMTIQPVDYIHKNGLSFLEGNVIKYITRHRTKGGRADVEKALHYCELLLQLEYGAAEEAEPIVIAWPSPKRRGRPPGAKNKKRKTK
jgi:hypothetical protein